MWTSLWCVFPSHSDHICSNVQKSDRFLSISANNPPNQGGWTSAERQLNVSWTSADALRHQWVDGKSIRRSVLCYAQLSQLSLSEKKKAYLTGYLCVLHTVAFFTVAACESTVLWNDVAVTIMSSKSRCPPVVSLGLKWLPCLIGLSYSLNGKRRAGLHGLLKSSNTSFFTDFMLKSILKIFPELAKAYFK